MTLKLSDKRPHPTEYIENSFTEDMTIVEGLKKLFKKLPKLTEVKLWPRNIDQIVRKEFRLSREDPITAEDFLAISSRVKLVLLERAQAHELCKLRLKRIHN